MAALPLHSVLLILALHAAVASTHRYTRTPLQEQRGVSVRSFNDFSFVTSNINQPGERTFHKSAAWSNDSLLIYGGVNVTTTSYFGDRAFFNCYDDMWVYYGADNTWERILYSESLPTPAARGLPAMEWLNIDGVRGLVVHAGFGCSSVSNSSGPIENRTPLNDTWVYFPHDNRWLELPLTESPGSVHGHSSFVINNTMYIFGGWRDAFSFTVLNDVWRLDIADKKWTKLNVTGQIPPGRGVCFSGVHQNNFFISGGSDGNDMLLNDTYALDVSTLTWRLVNAYGDLPPISEGASVVVGSTLVAIGGVLQETATSIAITYDQQLFPESSMSVWALDMSNPSARWTLVRNSIDTFFGRGVTGRIPTARQGHTATVLSTPQGGVVAMYGGIDLFAFDTLNDLWVLHNNTLWSQILVSTDPPHRSSHAMVSVGPSFVYVIGGWTTQYNRYIDVWVYDIATFMWTNPKNPIPSAGFLPAARAAHTVDVFNNTHLLMFGGVYNFPNGSWNYFGETWLLNTLNNTWYLCDNVTISPGPRGSHGSASVHGYGVVVFGGKDEVDCYNDVWVFDVETSDWRQVIAISGMDTPAPRWGHRIAAIQGDDGEHDIYIFGGRNFVELLGDMWILSLSDQVWRYVPQVGGPGGVAMYGLATLPTQKKFIIVGGAYNGTEVRYRYSLSRVYLGNFTSDVWEYDTVSGSWTLIETTGYLVPRVEIPAVIVNDFVTMYLFGGDSEDELLSDNVFIFLGCNRGSYSDNFANSSCLPCPLGTYASAPGMAACAGICPEGTTTSKPGATSRDDCNTCKPGACHGHGTCRVGAGQASTCVCDFGWTLSENCKDPLDIILIGTLVVISLLTGLGSQVFFHKINRLRTQAQTAYTLLDERDREVQDLTKAWIISPQDVTLERRIDGASEGAFAQVWLADWQSRPVAVKRLKDVVPELAIFSATITSNFEREIRLLRTLRHRNLVLFYGAGEMDGCPFLVTEFCQRGSLHGILMDWSIPLGFSRQISFALDAANGMKFLHGLPKPQIHRDLKSGNLLVTSNWIVKVADLGTATLVQELASPSGYQGSSARKMTGLVGTLPWMAPEVMKEEPYGPPVDVYSFGVVMWELITRKAPFEEIPNVTFVKLMDMVISGRRPSPIPEDCPDAYRELLQQCWSGDPELRPSFTQIVNILQSMR